MSLDTLASAASVDDTTAALETLAGSLEDEDVLDLVDALSRLSPTAARRATKPTPCSRA